MNLDYSVNYRNVSSFNFKNNYFTSSDGVLPEVCEEQQVSPVKGRLHTATGRKHKVTISGTECPKGSQSKLPAMVESMFTRVLLAKPGGLPSPRSDKEMASEEISLY